MATKTPTKHPQHYPGAPNHGIPVDVTAFVTRSKESQIYGANRAMVDPKSQGMDYIIYIYTLRRSGFHSSCFKLPSPIKMDLDVMLQGLPRMQCRSQTKSILWRWSHPFSKQNCGFSSQIEEGKLQMMIEKQQAGVSSILIIYIIYIYIWASTDFPIEETHKKTLQWLELSPVERSH